MSRIAIVVLASLLLAGCSHSSDGDPAPEATGPDTAGTPDSTSPAPPSAPAGPDCDTIWKPGQKLPADYTSCSVGGQVGAQEVIACQDDTSLVIYRDEYYAVTGGLVVEPDVAPLQDTSEYGKAYSACTGE